MNKKSVPNKKNVSPTKPVDQIDTIDAFEVRHILTCSGGIEMEYGVKWVEN